VDFRSAPSSAALLSAACRVGACGSSWRTAGCATVLSNAYALRHMLSMLCALADAYC
jgi:hypothetical protein